MVKIFVNHAVAKYCIVQKGFSVQTLQWGAGI